MIAWWWLLIAAAGGAIYGIAMVALASVDRGGDE